MAKQQSNTPNQLDKVLEEAFGIMDSINNDRNSTNRSSYLDDGDAEKLTKERKEYVRSVSRRFSEVLRRNLTIQPRSVFECLIVVGLEYSNEAKAHLPFIKSVYPSDAEYPEGLPYFCFPDAQMWPRDDNTNSLSYSLLITNEKGERKFGYCRRLVPEGSTSTLPVAYCLISSVRAHGFYAKVLTELERLHGRCDSELNELLSALYSHVMPSPGKTIHVLNDCRTILNITRPLDSRLEDVDVSVLTDSMDFPIFIKVFGTVLLERRLFFTSKSISKLSICVSALDSLLYPFSWQHILIPVVPSNLIDVCGAPTPFVLGILHPDLAILKDHNVEEDVLMVDVDSGRILKCIGDESTILPRKLQQALSCMLELVYKVTKPGEASRSLLISEFFITLYVELMGHYNQFIVTKESGKEFQREKFIKGAGSKSIQQFLDWFSETAMFTMFIEGKLKGNIKHEGLFERRVWEHSGNKTDNQKSQTIMKNAQEFSKKLKSWGGKMKDWKAFQ